MQTCTLSIYVTTADDNVNDVDDCCGGGGGGAVHIIVIPLKIILWPQM